MIIKRNVNLVVFITLSGLPILAHAQEETESSEQNTIEIIGQQNSYFEDSNTTAFKGEGLEDETPYQVSVINETLIEDLRAERLEDIFSYTTGISRSGDIADAFVVRGFDIDLTNLKVDGMPGLTTRFGSPSTFNVESVEVLKGPASVLYGNMETGGVVNITTKVPQKEAAASIEVSAQTYATDVSGFGDDNGYTTTLDLTGPVNGRDDLFYRFIATGENINSFRDDVSFENYHIAPSLLWEIDEQNSLLLSMEIGKENGSADHGLFAAQQDINTVADIDTVYQEPGDYDNDKGVAFNADFTHYFNDDSEYHFKWRSVLHTDERRLYESNSVNNVDLDAGESIADTTLRRRLRDQVNERDWHSFDTYAIKDFDVSGMNHNVTVGLAGEYRLTDFERKAFGSAGNVSPDLSIYDPVLGGSAAEVPGNHRKTEYYSAGIYAQDKVSVTDKLTVVGSGRVNRTKIDFTCVSGSCADDSSTNTTDFVGSLGAVYKLNDHWSVYANSAQSFDPYTAENLDADGNALDAEESTQYEIGLKYGVSDRLNTTLSVYKINKENVSETNADGDFETIGEVESKGVELDFQWLPTTNWQIKSGFAYNDSEIVEGVNKGLRNAHAPRKTAYLFTRYNLPTKVWGGAVGFSAGLNYRDEVKTDVSAANSVTLPSYTRFDVGAFYETKDWKMALNIENLADKEYFYAGSDDERIYVGDPRKVTLSLTKQF